MDMKKFKHVVLEEAFKAFEKDNIKKFEGKVILPV